LQFGANDPLPRQERNDLVAEQVRIDAFVDAWRSQHTGVQSGGYGVWSTPSADWTPGNKTQPSLKQHQVYHRLTKDHIQRDAAVAWEFSQSS
jgi:hypothetical protein